MYTVIINDYYDVSLVGDDLKHDEVASFSVILHIDFIKVKINPDYYNPAVSKLNLLVYTLLIEVKVYTVTVVDYYMVINDEVNLVRTNSVEENAVTDFAVEKIVKICITIVYLPLIEIIAHVHYSIIVVEINVGDDKEI